MSEIKKHFQLALKQGGILKRDADKIMELLSQETMLRMTGHEIDRRLIHPVLKEATILVENAADASDNRNLNLDAAVNQVLDDKKEMFILMNRYCL